MNLDSVWARDYHSGRHIARERGPENERGRWTTMPITFKIDRERDFTLFGGTGTLTVDDFLEVFDAYSKAGPTRLELYDFRDITESRMSGEEIRTLAMVGAAKSMERIPGSKTALVTDSNAEYGLSRMYQLLGEFEGVSWDVEVCRSIEAAYDWLGITPAP